MGGKKKNKKKTAWRFMTDERLESSPEALTPVCNTHVGLVFPLWWGGWGQKEKRHAVYVWAPGFRGGGGWGEDAPIPELV